jgi:hypothetical protein
MEGTMKKLLIVTLGLVLLLSLAVSAQEAKVSKISWGLKAGLGLGNVSGDSAKADPGWSKKMRLGFGGGAMVEYKFTPMIAARLELLYLMKGVKYDSGSVKWSVKADYLEFPLTLQVTPQMKGKVQPSFFAGPYLGMLLSAKQKSEGYEDADLNVETDVKDSLMKKTDFGITVGAGLNYLMKKGALTFDIRYDLGMSKVRKLVDTDNTEAPNDKTSAIYFLVGYKFDI